MTGRAGRYLRMTAALWVAVVGCRQARPYLPEYLARTNRRSRDATLKLRGRSLCR